MDMPEYAVMIVDDYLTAMWSDDPSAERRAEDRMKHLTEKFGEANVTEWTHQRSEVIYGTR